MGKQETKPTKVDKIPEGYVLGEKRNGIQYWVMEDEKPGTDPKGNPPKNKNKVGGTPNKQNYRPPQGNPPVKVKKEVYLEAPPVEVEVTDSLKKDTTPKNTVLYGGAKGYGRNVVEAATPDYDVMEFPDATGNYTNNAQRRYFIKGTNKEIDSNVINNYDASGKFVPKLTGDTLDNIRLTQGLQQIEKPTDSGVNKVNTAKNTTFLKPGAYIDVNSTGGQGVNPNTVKGGTKASTDVFVPNEGLKPVGTPVNKSRNVGEMYGVEQPKLIKGSFKKGGLVERIKGYDTGGLVIGGQGVVQFGNEYGKPTGNATTNTGATTAQVGPNAEAEARKKKKEAQAEKNRQNVGDAMGVYGKTYLATAPSSGSQDSTTKTAMGAVSNAGAVGGVIGGVYGIIDKPAREEKNRAEKMNVTVDKNGNATAKLDSSARAKETAIAGSFLSPSEALTTRMSYEGGMTDVTGKGYTDYLKKKAQEQLDVYNKANQTNKQNQAVAAREQGNINPTMENTYNLRGATFGDDKQLQLAKGGLVHKVKQMCSEGGEIKGKGGPKDDKIEAKVKEGSFVVPAENAELAKGIRKLYLKAPIKKANLNQKGGEEVMLSNKEHLFTPEENEYLESVGIDLEDLAPNAEEGNKKAEGGDVVDPAKELAKIEAEKKNIEAIKAKREADRTAAEKAALQRSIIEARKSDRQSQVKSWEKKYSDSKTKLDALNKSYEDMVKGFDEMGNATKKDRAIGVAGTKDAAYQRKSKEELLKKIQEADKEFKNAKQTYDYVKDDNNYNATGESKISEAKRTGLKAPVVPKGVKKEDVATATKPSLKAPVVKKKEVIEDLPSKDIAIQGLKQDAELKAANPIINEDKAINNTVARQEAINTDLEKKNADYIAKSTPRKKGLSDAIGSFDPTSIVGIGQALAGKKMLSGEVRPEDKAVIDRTYDANVDRAQRDAQYGFTPEQRALLEQDQENALNDARFSARNFAGGNASTAFNQERQAINQGLAAKLGLRVADQDLRLQKAQYADAQAKERANMRDYYRRRAFEDAMSTFQQKQQAGSELIGAGLANTIEAYRFNKQMQERNKREGLDWSKNYTPSV